MPFSLGPNEGPAYLETGIAPAPHLDMLGAVAFRAAGAGVRLGVFEALGDGERSLADLAAATGTDERTLRLLADVLVGAGYLTRSASGYANSATTAKWLRRDAPGSYLPTLMLWQDLLFELWDDLERTVRDGRPAVDFYQWLEARPDKANQFQQMLATLASWLSEEVVELVEVPDGATSLLDVAGGHARYSIAFCLRHPELRATVVDLPAALTAGKEAVDAAGLADRITLVAADVFNGADLGADHDVALVFNFLHGNSAERNAGLLAEVRAALRPQGTIAILDQLAGADVSTDSDSVADEAFLRSFSLNLFHTQGGRLLSRDEIVASLTDAGFDEPTWHQLRRMPTDHLAVATTPTGSQQ